jgi:hypothetical protein
VATLITGKYKIDYGGVYGGVLVESAFGGSVVSGVRKSIFVGVF